MSKQLMRVLVILVLEMLVLLLMVVMVVRAMVPELVLELVQFLLQLLSLRSGVLFSLRVALEVQPTDLPEPLHEQDVERALTVPTLRVAVVLLLGMAAHELVQLLPEGHATHIVKLFVLFVVSSDTDQKECSNHLLTGSIQNCERTVALAGG
jgi:hypothetical protein